MTKASDADLARYECWLRMLARMQLGPQLQAKFDPSDIVQQTMFEAWRDRDQFRGASERERAGWLRQILAHVLAKHVRDFRGTQKRNASREVSLEERLQASSMKLVDLLSVTQTSPSGRAARMEEELLLADALERLPPDYREVLTLRNLQGLSHEQIAQQMQRTTGSVRMLWVRALARLKKTLDSAG